MTTTGAIVLSIKASAVMRSLLVVEMNSGTAFALPRRAVEQAGLNPGLALLPRMAADLAELEQRTAYRLALARLARWERTAAETEAYLRERGFGTRCVETTVRRLVEEHALDDSRAAESHVAARGRHGNRGQRFVRRELLQRGVPAAIAEHATGELDDETAAVALATSRAARRQWSDSRAFATSVGPMLLRRGFNHETVRRALSAAWQAEHGNERGLDLEGEEPGPSRF